MVNYEEENFYYLLKEKNLLLYGVDEFEHLHMILNRFNLFLHQEVTQFTLDNLTGTIAQNSINVIIINDTQHLKSIYDKLHEVVAFEDIIVLLTISEKQSFCDELINMAQSAITPKVTVQQFAYKLYHDLLTPTMQVEHHSQNVETYVDSFEIEIIFIRDELMYIAQKIDDGDISQHLISKLTSSLGRINVIYQNYLIYSEKIKQSIQTFEAILKEVDLTKMEGDNYESFEYLARIIEDVATFLDNYFIKRIYNDLYIVEDSMANSLKFLKDSFENKDNSKDGSTLEFFND